MHAPAKKLAFTLVELAIVLVIIGLIFGGVLAGKDLIEAAQIRSQIKQIDDYRLATLAFKVKYNHLPGDMPEPHATQFGFTARGPYAGEGDGNGVIEGVFNHAPANNNPFYQTAGETAVFWKDLSQAGLIAHNFTVASATTHPAIQPTEATSPSIEQFIPRAKIAGNYVLVGGAPTIFEAPPWVPNAYPQAVSAGKNYIYLSSIYELRWNIIVPSPTMTLGLTVSQAYAIDSKMDDGVPVSGKVVALRLNGGFGWSPVASWGASSAGNGAASPASATTCFDNNNSIANTPAYSMSFNGGETKICSLVMQIY